MEQVIQKSSLVVSNDETYVRRKRGRLFAVLCVVILCRNLFNVLKDEGNLGVLLATGLVCVDTEKPGACHELAFHVLILALLVGANPTLTGKEC